MSPATPYKLHYQEELKDARGTNKPTKTNFSKSTYKKAKQTDRQETGIPSPPSHQGLSGIVWTETARNGASRSHTSNIVPVQLAERIWCTKFYSSLLNIYFCPREFQASPIFTYFRDGRNRCAHHTNYGTILIRYVTVHFRDRHGKASLLYRNSAATTVLVCENRSHIRYGESFCPTFPAETVETGNKNRCVIEATHVLRRKLRKD